MSPPVVNTLPGHLSSDSKHSVSLRKGDDAGHPHPVTHRHACRKLVMPQRLGQGARAHRFGQLCHSKSPTQISVSTENRTDEIYCCTHRIQQLKLILSKM